MNYKGIRVEQGKWRVRVWNGQVEVHVGLFDTLGEAIGARDAAFNLLSSEDVCRYNRGSEPSESVKLVVDRFSLEELWSTPLNELLSRMSTPTETEDIFENILINGKPFGGDSSLEEEEERPLVQSREVPFFDGEPPKKVLVFADLHAPYHHPDAIDFLEAVSNHYKPDLVLNLGDEVDMNSLSFYPQSPELHNATAELREARKVIQEIDSRVIKGTPCYSVESNHTSRVYRKGKSAGIPKDLLLPYEQVLGVDWKWSKSLTVRLPNGTDLYVVHNSGGNTIQLGQTVGSNVIAGHYHKRSSIMWWVSHRLQHLFAAHCPCLIDFDHPAYSYDENSIIRPNLGCMMIIDSRPVIIVMEVDKDNRWIYGKSKRKSGKTHNSP